MRGDFVFFNTLGGRYSHMGILWATDESLCTRRPAAERCSRYAWTMCCFAKRFTEAETSLPERLRRPDVKGLPGSPSSFAGACTYTAGSGRALPHRRPAADSSSSHARVLLLRHPLRHFLGRESLAQHIAAAFVPTIERGPGLPPGESKPAVEDCWARWALSFEGISQCRLRPSIPATWRCAIKGHARQNAIGGARIACAAGALQIQHEPSAGAVRRAVAGAPVRRWRSQAQAKMVQGSWGAAIQPAHRQRHADRWQKPPCVAW